MVVDLSRERDRAAWYCLRTESKREHVAAANIRTQVEAEVYCPRVSYHKMTRRGKVRFTEAMFPGYIFVRCEILEAMRHLLAMGGVVSVVRYGSDIPAVPAEFVEELKARPRLCRRSDLRSARTVAGRRDRSGGDGGAFLELRGGSKRRIDGYATGFAAIGFSGPATRVGDAGGVDFAEERGSTDGLAGGWVRVRLREEEEFSNE